MRSRPSSRDRVEDLNVMPNLHRTQTRSRSRTPTKRPGTPKKDGTPKKTRLSRRLIMGALSDQSLQDIASKLKYNNYVWVCQHLGYMKHEVDTLTQHLPHDPHIRGMHVLGHWRDTYTRGDKVTCLSKALRKCRFHSLANDLVDRQRAMPLCTAV